MRMRNARLGALGHPLMCAGRALAELPFVFEEVLKVIIAPLRRCLRPGDFKPTGDGVATLAAAEAALPSEALLFDRRRFGIGPDMLGIARTVRLAKGMTTGNERDGLLVIHRHPREGLTNVTRRGEWIRIAVGTLGVDIDQAHLHRSQRVFQFAIATVTLVGKPFLFHAPIDVFLRLPNVGTTAAETEGLEAHRIQRDIAGQNHQIGPRNFASVLFLDRPQQTTRLIEVAIVRPAVEWRKSLTTVTRTATAITGAICAGAVPSHADEERPVVSKVRRPPLLRVGHQSMQILLHRIEIKALELGAVIKTFAHRIGLGGVLMKNAQVELVGPPVAVGGAGRGGLTSGNLAVIERAFGFVGHNVWGLDWLLGRNCRNPGDVNWENGLNLLAFNRFSQHRSTAPTQLVCAPIRQAAGTARARPHTDAATRCPSH